MFTSNAARFYPSSKRLINEKGVVILADNESPVGPGEHSRVYGTLEKPSFNVHAISSGLRRERIVREKGQEGKNILREVAESKRRLFKSSPPAANEEKESQ